jgi:hypothetical protein
MIIFYIVHISDDLQVFHSAKRTGIFSHWEPVYIGTHSEPYFDERLTWEGRSDKMQQVPIIYYYYFNYFFIPVNANQLKFGVVECERDLLSHFSKIKQILSNLDFNLEFLFFRLTNCVFWTTIL